MWRIVHQLIPRYAPWYGGLYEVTRKVLVRTLAVVIAESEKREWNSLLYLATWVYNNRP
jgi:hypothetical protein